MKKYSTAKPAKACAAAGCTAVTTGKYCDACRKERQRETARTRTDNNAFYRSPQWRKFRNALMKTPGFRWCVECEKGGRKIRANTADHIIPIADRPDLAFEPSNIQPLCKSHHGRKTMGEMQRRKAEGGRRKESTPLDDLAPGPAFRRVVLCGPPGSGKSTLAADRREPGDVVFDWDAILRTLTGLSTHRRPARFTPMMLAVREAVVATLEASELAADVWILIYNLATARTIAERIGAELIVTDATEQECLARVRSDAARPDGGRGDEASIRKWFARFGEDQRWHADDHRKAETRSNWRETPATGHRQRGSRGPKRGGPTSRRV